MTIQPDHWIRKMAREHGMIEPFVEKQVSNHVISYGVSSYGYDIRVADEFMIFTNVYSAIVDPKHFDPKSMVDFTGDVCIIPPNSFALGRTIEYFRVPRNVLCVCVGKSTYARCFRGDTRVALVDGTAPTLEEMARRSDDGEDFWGYSIGPYGRMMVTRLESPRYVGTDNLVEIVLDTGQSIFCTPDHLFLMRDGRMIQADRLRPGHALMPLYRQLARGYEMVYQPLDGHLYPTHRLADEWNLRHWIYEDLPDTHRRHVDSDRRNNRPWNITRMNASEHIRYHNRETYGKDFDPDEHSAAIRCDRSVFRRLPDVIRAFKGKPQNENHSVVAIRAVPGNQDVYCLTVPEAGNFALEAGVFVSNCGIIVNITPFEPEWQGHVTLEISNTTPLPAKIYANEGIAQVLFFVADEECEVSYKDKKGKYDKQTGIVLPRIIE